MDAPREKDDYTHELTMRSSQANQGRPSNPYKDKPRNVSGCTLPVQELREHEPGATARIHVPRIPDQANPRTVAAYRTKKNIS